MEIVSGNPAPTQEPDAVRNTLLELAAVIRTIFGAPAAVEQAPVQPAAAQQPQPHVDQLEPVGAKVAEPAPVVPLEVPDLPQPLAVPDLTASEGPAPQAAPAAIQVPEIQQIPVPDLAPAHPAALKNADSHADQQTERHSMALLQEIAFLDD